jgi:ribosomal protein S28E/S33
MDVQKISQDDLNNYLAWRIATSPAAIEGTGFRMEIRQVDVRIGENNQIRVNALAALGPLKISNEIVGRIEVKPGQPFRMAVHQARIGHMPMPESLRPFVTDKVALSLSGMSRDRDFLNRARQVNTTNGMARIVVGP